jgi:hypothetical protein
LDIHVPLASQVELNGGNGMLSGNNDTNGMPGGVSKQKPYAGDGQRTCKQRDYPLALVGVNFMPLLFVTLFLCSWLRSPFC